MKDGQIYCTKSKLNDDNSVLYSFSYLKDGQEIEAYKTFCKDGMLIASSMNFKCINDLKFPIGVSIYALDVVPQEFINSQTASELLKLSMQTIDSFIKKNITLESQNLALKMASYATEKIKHAVIKNYKQNQNGANLNFKNTSKAI